MWSYCSDWSKQRYTSAACLGVPLSLVLFLPFEMLLQLPEQKLHCYVVMALCPCSQRSHGAVSQQDHIESRGVRPELLCVAPRFWLSLTKLQIWVATLELLY